MHPGLRMNIEISIAVSPAVKKYVAHKHDITPFVVSRTNSFGIFLHNCLSRMKQAYPAIVCKELNPAIYSEKLTLGLSEDLWSRHGWYIHPKKQYDFNRLAELMIDQDFYFFVDVQTQVCSAKFDHAFFDFRDIFHLSEDDLTLKTMQKRYERYRSRLNA
jgi:hypothetical protein